MIKHKHLACMILNLLVLIWLAATEAFAQGAYTVALRQVDTGRYPNITLYVNVKDSAGNLVGGLKKEQFSITEDGAAVDIIDFAGTGEVRTVDIVFVFDTTGSMTEEIEGVKRTSISFAQKLKDKGRNYRLGLVAFGDEIRGIYQSDRSLTDNAEEFKGWISTLRAEGGGDTPENSLGAIKEATQMNFRSGTQKILILITDAPAHHYGEFFGLAFNDADLTADRISKMLREKSITLYAVACDSSDYRQLVSDTNGEFYPLTPTTDFTGIIDKIGQTIAEQYKMSYKSARPTHDGTRRNIIVSVDSASGAPGESGKGGGTYVEQHLVNFKSDVLIATLFLLPLLLALVAPLPFVRRKRPPALVVSSTKNCPHCNTQNQSLAKFCKSCGQSMDRILCRSCQTEMRPNARFCQRCGTPR